MNTDSMQENMNAKDKVEFLFKKILRYDFYISSTNAKASIVIAWNGIVIGTILLKYDSILCLYLSKGWSYSIANVLLIIIAVASIISIALMMKVVNPFLLTGSINGNSKSLIFFGDVSKMSINEYLDKEINSSYDEIQSDAMRQAYILATSLNEKMMNMQQSIRAIYFGLLALFLLVLLRGIITYV